MRRRIALVAVVALVALAGCSAVPLGGDDASTNDPANDDGPAANDEAPTLESVAYPDGYDATGITDADRALSTHDDAVANATGVRVSASMLTTAGDERRELVLESTADNDAGTEYSTLELTDGSSEVYRAADGSAYTRIDDGSNVEYHASEAAPRNPVTLSSFRDSVSAVDLSATAVSTEGSTTLITYTADELKESADSVQGTDDVSVELVVDTDGRIHSLSIVYGGGDTEVDFQFEYGPTTVEEPDWLDEAKAATES